MKMIKMMSILLASLLFACGDANNASGEAAASQSSAEVIDDGKGIGEITSVTLNTPLNPEMISKGKAIYEMKCAACHKLSDQRVVGPGWDGLTTKRKPEWIMNMVTNVEVMLEKDPAAYELLKQCLVRMPNQNISIDDSRDILEFMYANDGQTVAE